MILGSHTMETIKKVDYAKLIKRTGMSLYRIERETEIAHSTLRRLRDGVTTDPHVSTHNRLAKFINKMSK